MKHLICTCGGLYKPEIIYENPEFKLTISTIEDILIPHIGRQQARKRILLEIFYMVANY